MFYSQFGEDKLLSKYFNDNYKGVCIEVGAYDGISGSNTYHFENKGWDTLCIEPTPEAFIKCSSIRKNCINCCVSNYDSENSEYFVVRLNGDNTSAISSLNIDNRLIESHKHMINNIEKISVNVKTLNNIFKEINFPKKIDFISIDTENTELDVLKGLNFYEYEIKFLVIANNFDEPQVENYLKTQNFKKLFRNVVNDFYVNNNYINTPIFDIFEIKKAVYYIEDSDDKGIVTDNVKLLFQKYKLSQIITYSRTIVSNDIFTDTYPNQHKKLYITIENNCNIKQYKLIFDEGETLDFSEINNYLLKTIDHHSYKIETSIGEIVDKFSILQLKQKYIKNIDKLSEIQKEIDILSEFIKHIDKFFYNLLLHINELIWLDTDIIKAVTLDKKEYKNIYLISEISNRIFENNQKRFRLKTYFNVLQYSNIKEQKSYNNDVCYIDIKNEDEIYSKIPEINYLCISYDIIYISYEFKNIFNKLFKNPNIFFTEQKDNYEKYYKLETFSIHQNISKQYDFEPIKYVSGGKLGDFLNQLSVIAENYYETGKKGILFITNNKGDTFSNGLENTYNDTFETIISQEYIKSYNIYNNEEFDIDLTSWRSTINFFNIKNFKYLYSKHYKVDWGKHKWLVSSFDSKWENKIIINNNHYEVLSENTINVLRELINNNKDNCIFISNDNESYYKFLQNIGIKIEYYKPSNFSELVKIVNSSKMAYLGFSAIAVISNSLHRPHILTGHYCCNSQLNNMKEEISHILDIII
jgi:FkbM family methyltransferase